MPRSRAEWDEELAAEMLEDLEELSGISIGEMMADALEERPEVSPDELRRADEEGQFDVFPVFDEPTEDRPLDLENPDGEETEDYFDILFDEIDVDQEEVDQYGDE